MLVYIVKSRVIEAKIYMVLFLYNVSHIQGLQNIQNFKTLYTFEISMCSCFYFILFILMCPVMFTHLRPDIVSILGPKSDIHSSNHPTLELYHRLCHFWTVDSLEIRVICTTHGMYTDGFVIAAQQPQDEVYIMSSKVLKYCSCFAYRKKRMCLCQQPVTKKINVPIKVVNVCLGLTAYSWQYQ